MEEDDRLRPILVNVEKQYIGKEYGVDGAVTGTVRAGDVDKVSIQDTFAKNGTNYMAIACSCTCSSLYDTST